MVAAAVLYPTSLGEARLPAPSTRAPRTSMALSLVLHAAVALPLLAAGAPGSVTAEEPAFMVEIALAAPAPAPDVAVPAADIAVETAPEPPPVDSKEVADAKTPPPPPEPEPTINVELPPPDEPPPLDTAQLAPPEPNPEPKPQPPKPAPPKPLARPAPAPKPVKPAAPATPAVTQTASPPDAGTARTTQHTAALPPSAIVWEDRPRFRAPPVPAVYPPKSIELGQQGEARIRVRLDPDGAAAEILLHRSSGFDLLDRAALVAVRRWRFMPAVRDGRAVAAWVEIPVRFHLR